jgi:hypothetical protein
MRLITYVFLFLLIDISSTSSPPIFGFWHIGVAGLYLEVVEDQLSQIENAVFVTNVTIVRIMSTNLTRTDVESLIHSHPGKVKLGQVMFIYGTEKEGEESADTTTTWILRSFSELIVGDAIIWFIHNKGVTHSGTAAYTNVRDWRRMMMYFLFEKDWCVTALREDFYDTCGSNLRQRPMKHYSGTFWMAHARYVKTLPYASNFWHPRPYGDRFAGEFWVLHSRIDHSRSLCVHDSVIDMYTLPYPRSQYALAPIGLHCKYKVLHSFLKFLANQS